MNGSGVKVLLVDDDAELQKLLGQYLAAEAMQVVFAGDGQTALEKLQQDKQVDVVVLDIMMPGINGLETLKLLRQFSQVPVIMLTGRGDDIDRIIGLEMGADDYLGKPCNPRELLARIRAVLRRGKPETLPAIKLQAAGIELDAAARHASFLGRPLELTAAEFNVLRILLEHAGEAVSREALTRQVLHRELTAYDRSIDVHVSRIRKKLQLVSGDEKDMIKTLRGQGYQLVCRT